MRRVAQQVTIDRRQINDDRRRVFGAGHDLIAFVCECEDDACARTVALSAGDFDRRRPGPLLDAVHDGYSKNATTARIA
jgi:hypothetical protein